MAQKNKFPLRGEEVQVGEACKGSLVLVYLAAACSLRTCVPKWQSLHAPDLLVL